MDFIKYMIDNELSWTAFRESSKEVFKTGIASFPESKYTKRIGIRNFFKSTPDFCKSIKGSILAPVSIDDSDEDKYHNYYKIEVLQGQSHNQLRNTNRSDFIIAMMFFSLKHYYDKHGNTVEQLTNFVSNRLSLAKMCTLEQNIIADYISIAVYLWALIMMILKKQNRAFEELWECTCEITWEL